jgi:4-hydroxybenzoate polyprenyltransferase
MPPPLFPESASPLPSSPWLPFAQLIRLFNQTGTILLLLPTLWALFLASKGWPDIDVLLIFILGSFVMRSAGVIMNDLADKSFDRQVHRTRLRPLAAGSLSSRQAVGFLLVLLGIAFGLLLALPPLVLLLSPMALLLAGIYPFCKRYLHLPQLILGLAFGWGVIMAWAAVQNRLEVSTWILYVSTACWAVVYDTIYAIQDMGDDRRIGVKSSAIFWGASLWLGVGLFGCLMLMGLSIIGLLGHLGISYYLALGIVAVLITYQVYRLRFPVTPDMAFSMFQQHRWIGFLILAGILFGIL